ncbi:hypothetical protein F9C28_19520 [Shimwellia pseudoproteus]|nr:hypothetical protein [Shimwellia pseudoproteus]
MLCHRMSLQGQECGDLILISAKSSIYSTKPFAGSNRAGKILSSGLSTTAIPSWVIPHSVRLPRRETKTYF